MEVLESCVSITAVDIADRFLLLNGITRLLLEGASLSHHLRDEASLIMRDCCESGIEYGIAAITVFFP